MEIQTFSGIVAGVLQRDTLALYLFIICLDYVLQTSIDLMKGNGFTLEKTKSRRYSAETITEAIYADDIALLTNIPAQAESLLEQAAGGIRLYVNADKMEYMYFHKEGDISTLNGGSLKFVNKFKYLSSSVSSTEGDINMRLAKAWTAIDGLSITWKSNQSDKIKRNFFQVSDLHSYILKMTVMQEDSEK